MFIILLVATATLDGLPPYRTVLNCFHLLWLYLLYPYLAGSAAYLVGPSIAFTCSFTCITLKLYYYYITMLPLPMLCPLPPLWYIYIIVEAERKWIPTIKGALTNRITSSDTYNFKKRYIILFGNAIHPLKASQYKYKKINRLKLDVHQDRNREERCEHRE